MKPAIKVENLSKLYRIGTRQNKADTLREKLTQAIAAPSRPLFGRNGRGGEGSGFRAERSGAPVIQGSGGSVERGAVSVEQLTPESL